MATTNASLAIPQKPAHRRAWVKFQLSLKGLSFAALAEQIDVSPQAIKDALLKPSARIEEEIASAIKVPVEKLFPERFDANGERLHKVRAAHRTQRPSARNAKPARSR